MGDLEVKALFCLFNMRRFRDCLRHAKNLVDDFDSIPFWTDNLRQYFLCFVKVLGQECAKELYGTYDAKKFPEFEFYFDEIKLDMDSIPARYRRNFPLRYHPDWKKPPLW